MKEINYLSVMNAIKCDSFNDLEDEEYLKNFMVFINNHKELFSYAIENNSSRFISKMIDNGFKIPEEYNLQFIRNKWYDKLTIANAINNGCMTITENSINLIYYTLSENETAIASMIYDALPTDAKSIELGNIIELFELTYDIVDLHDDVLLSYEDLVIKATKKLLNVINIKLDYSDYDFNISKLVYKILTSDKGIDHLEPAVPIIEGLIQIYKRDHYDKCEKYFKCLEFVLKIRLSFGKDE